MEDLQTAVDLCLKLSSLKQTLDSSYESDLNEIYAALLHQIKISNFDPQELGKWASTLLSNISLFNNQERIGLTRPLPEPGHFTRPSRSKLARKDKSPRLAKRVAQALLDFQFKKSSRIS